MSNSDETSNPTSDATRLAAAATPLSSIARGSAWTIGARWCMRSIGIVSTVILARLLSPADFGIVAMAMIAVGFVQVFSEAGQNLAIIRHADPTPEHFDTAWTMSVGAGCIVALVLVAIAPLAGWYYREPQVVSVIRFLALAPLIEGFTNIGVVAGFRRDLLFHKDFAFLMVRKLSTAGLTVPLAVLLQDYWALAIGIVGGRVVIVAASYCMHHYRPRLRLPKLRELWSFSAWMQIAEIGNFLADRTDQIIIGGLAGAPQMGAYSVAADFAAAPAEELVLPAARATYPVYATLLHDPASLARAYLGVLSITAIAVLSTGFGLALVADDLVALVLGQKWMVAAPLVPYLAIAAAMFGVARTVNVVLSVTGNARLIAIRIVASVAVLAPAAIVGELAWGAEGVAGARMIVTVLFIPVMFYSLAWTIPVTYLAIIECLWRPALATVVMCGAVLLYGLEPPELLALRLFSKVGLGAIVFAVTLFAVWFLAGCPAGGERMLVNRTSDTLRPIVDPIDRLIRRFR